MALSSTGVFEVRYTGNDNNAGYFNPSGTSPGTDYSLQDSAQVTIDGTTITAAVQGTTTDLLLVGVSVSNAWNRNGLRITGGTATAGLYEIVAVNTGTNVVTLDRSAGTAAQTVVGAIGGAFASPGKASSFSIAENTIFVKYNATPYSITVASPNVSNGYMSPIGGIATNYTKIIGYDTTRVVTNTDINLPTMTGSSALIMFSLAGNYMLAANFILNGTNTYGITFGFITNQSVIFNCHVFNSSSVGIGTYGAPPALVICIGCTVTNCSGIGYVNVYQLHNCKAIGCGTGFLNQTKSYLATRCIAANNTNDGFSAARGLLSCISYNNGRDGFNFSVGGEPVNCIAYNNGRYGFTSTAIATMYMLNNASGNNTSGNSYVALNDNMITLTADPFVNAAAGDFRLNNNAGGGALCRKAGFPTESPDNLTLNYLDIGYAQSVNNGIMLSSGF